jgi:type II secretory pathway component PulF
MGVRVARMRSWDAHYIARSPLAGRPVVPERKAPGWYRHVDVEIAASEADVRERIFARGGVPVAIRPIRPRHPLLQRVSGKYKKALLESVRNRLADGVSPGEALERVIKAESGPLRAQLDVGLHLLEQGRSFLEAFDALDLYDESTLAIIEAGEETGKLAQALESAIEYLDKSSTGTKLILGTAAWTVIDLFGVQTALIGTRLYGIPALRKEPPQGASAAQLESFHHSLDWATVINDVMIALSMLVLFGLGVAGYAYFGRDAKFRSRIDEVLLKVPMLRNMLVHSALAGTCSVMASLLKGGVNFLPACRITMRGSRLSIVNGYWSNAHRDVDGGKSTRAALARPPLVGHEQMRMQSHSDQGSLARAFENTAKEREEESRIANKAFGVVLFFASIVFAALGVLAIGFVAYVQNEYAFSAFGAGS